MVRRFGRLTAVDGVDLDVRRGEVFGFLGPNGAGKSTLIRMLVGLLPPVGGRDRRCSASACRASRSELRPRVGYMTQQFSLYEDLTVEENLDFAGQIFGLAAAERRRRIEELLEEYEMGERRKQFPAHLSGGWKQRLALAAATIHKPELLLLDEPTAGVDPDRRRTFWEKLFELAAEGTTILVSTHYMDEAVRCHRLCMLIRGQRVALGSPATMTQALEDRVVEVAAEPVDRAIAVLRAWPQSASVDPARQPRARAARPGRAQRRRAGAGHRAPAARGRPARHRRPTPPSPTSRTSSSPSGSASGSTPRRSRELRGHGRAGVGAPRLVGGAQGAAPAACATA